MRLLAFHWFISHGRVCRSGPKEGLEQVGPPVPSPNKMSREIKHGTGSLNRLEHVSAILPTASVMHYLDDGNRAPRQLLFCFALEAAHLEKWAQRRKIVGEVNIGCFSDEDERPFVSSITCS
jgi:hypothetical protein